MLIKFGPQQPPQHPPGPTHPVPPPLRPAPRLASPSCFVQTSVWTPPWDPKLFDVQEIERDVFLEVCLDEFLLPHSPFNSLLDKLPTDLWPNAEAYLEQLEGGETLF